MLSKFAWLVAIALAVASFVDPNGFRRYNQMKKEVQTLSAKNRATAEKNRAMRLEIEALHGDRTALEKAAREELGFVRPGEIVIHLE